MPLNLPTDPRACCGACRYAVSPVPDSLEAMRLARLGLDPVHCILADPMRGQAVIRPAVVRCGVPHPARVGEFGR